MRGPRNGYAQRVKRPLHTPTPITTPQPSPPPSRRDSDVSSLCSSLKAPSSSVPDSAYHFRSINSYLSSLSPPLHLRPPFPPTSSLTLALRALLSRLSFPHPLSDLTRDLPPLLSALRCPINLPKSALKAPSTPHSLPSLLSVLHWLTQLARASDLLSSSPPSPLPSDIDINSHITRSYSLFLAGDDAAAAHLDAQYLEKLKRHADSSAKEVEALEARVREWAALLEDARKFGSVVEKFRALVGERREGVAERERELGRREAEGRRLEGENEELRRRVRGQEVSARDVERMVKELRIVEGGIAEGEERRNAMEERALRLDEELERRFREMEGLAEEANREIRK